MNLTILGPPRTKKNSRVYVDPGRNSARRKPIPSDAWREWVRRGVIQGWNGITIIEPVAIEATFYRDARRGDLAGYFQGLSDFLEARHVIANDSQIQATGLLELDVDRENPRVEVVLMRRGMA